MYEWVRKAALHAKTKEEMVMATDVDMRVWLRASNREWLTTLNAKVQIWLWMPNWKEVVALNAGTEKIGWLRALNRKWWRLWTSRLRRNSGSERRYWEVITMTLNVEWRCDDGSERRNQECKSECQTSDYYQKVLFCRPNYNGFKHLWVVIIFI